MVKIGCLSVAVLITACAEQPTEGELDDWRYRRDTAHIEAEEAFEDKKHECARSRGLVIVNRTFSRRMREGIEDPGLATCMPGQASATF